MCTASTLPATSAATGTTKACTRACEVLGVSRSPTKYSTRLATISTAMTSAPMRAPRPVGAGSGAATAGGAGSGSGSVQLRRVRRQGPGSWNSVLTDCGASALGAAGSCAHGVSLVEGGRNSAEGGGNGACSSAFQSLRSPIVVCVASSSSGRERAACQPPPIAL